MGLSDEQISALLTKPRKKVKSVIKRSGPSRTYEGPFAQRTLLFITRFIQDSGCSEPNCGNSTNVRIVGKPYCLDHCVDVINNHLEGMRLPIRVCEIRGVNYDGNRTSTYS
jgi:hypothetical protein